MFKLELLKKYCSDYSSPMYVYAKEVIAHQYELLQKFLPKKCQIFYAQKSNPNKELLEYICKLGLGCDTASVGEIKSALQAGFKPQKLMYTGPGKRAEEIKYAVKKGILSINIESIQELEIVDKIACQLGVKQTILVRINPPYQAGEEIRLIGGSGVSKFGIDIEQMDDFFSALKNKCHVSLKGIHIFNASQILDWKKIFANTKNVIDTAQSLSDKYQLEFAYIDLGGGFGIPYAHDEAPLDLPALGPALNELIRQKKYQAFLGKIELVFELGRFLSGPAGVYLTKVLYTKRSHSTNIAIVDGGLNHLARPALARQKCRMVNLTGLFEKRAGIKTYMVAGPLCTALDCFDEQAQLCETRPGDILAILNIGAYGFTESMPWFLSHPIAKEIVF
jgi:diaminopimelate decarboxylase